ncbi:YadA-like family protein [Mitsuokella jalaludinii]|uniref:YadA-like family protein n=1 Tax=Mitsuokella jalaludinii TaxID=187979 RepID=UPI0022E617D4|nr:YadA-like family protein [Mitsuokella jalaludinii]
MNPGSQTANADGTAANGDGDADAMAIGPNAKASSVKALAIGNNVSASGTLSIAIGTASNPSTDTTTAETPHPTSSEGTSSVAIGTSAIAQTNDSIAIGTRAATYTANTTSTPVSTVGVQSVAIGFSAETRDDNAISIGTKSKANSADAVAIGDGAEALNTNAVVIGKASTAEGSDSVTIGMSNANNGKAVITTGNSNRITNSQGVKDTVQNSGLYGSSNAISSVSSSNTSNAITDVYAVGNGNKLNQMGEKNVLTDVSIMGNQNAIENGTAGAYTQTVKQIAVVGSGNKVKGNTQIDYNTWGTVQRDTILGYKNTVDATTQWTPVSNLQILGNDVTATLGNSVYLGTGSSATASKSATTEAITLAKEQGDAEAIASDEYKKATTEAEQTAIKQKYEAKYIHAANIAAMDQDGISAGITNYDKDYTYGNDSAYTYAGSQATGVVTVGSKDATRRIQNVSAGLVGPNSTDAVNGSQLYALTRQIRFGGDNSTFGKTAAADDVNVVAKGSNEKLAITGGAEGVSNTTTTDGKSVTTVDGTKIADKNIAVIAEDDALHVKLASNLKDLNTAQLGKTTATTTKADDGTETTTYSYQETLKLDGTGDNGGTLALKDAKGENGVTLRTSGATKTADVTGAETNRLLVNDKTVATTDDGLKFGGDTGTDSALKLNNKLTVKGGATTGLSDNNNIGVVSNGTGTLTVKLNKDVNLGTDGSLTAGAVTAATVTTGNSKLDNTGLTITGGPKFTSTGISANGQQIKAVKAGTDDTDAANYSQIKKATTTLTTGKNGNVNVTSDSTSADGHTNYTIAVDNLAVKANGTGNTTVALANGINFRNGTNTTSAVDSNGNVTIDTKNLTLKANGTNQASVSMDGGINFKDGMNTTATVGTDGMVTISATHNKLDSASYTASKPSDSSNKTTLKLKDTDGNETTLNLTDTYTTVSKNTDHTITFKRNDGSEPVSISLDDLNGASNEALTKAAAKATTTVIKGTNVDSVDDDMTSADGHHIYKVNVSNLGVKVADGQKTSVALSDGLVFGNGTNTTASVGQNGAITFNVSNDAIKTQAKDAINMKAGTNVNVDTEPSKDSLSKTFTISATHNALKSATITSKSNDVSTLTITGNDGDTASVDIKNTHLTVTKDSKAKTVTFTSNDGTTPATTLSLSDLGAASTADMNAAKAAASTEVKAGTNASLGTVETNQTDQHKIYTVNVDNLGLKQNGTAAGTVMLADGINFADGTNTSATVSDGKVMFDLKKDITNIDTITASNSIQAGNVKVGKQGTDNKNYVTGLENKNWTVGQTTYEAGRAATEDQLKSVSDKVASGFQVTDGTTSANIGADKKVTFTNGNYTTAKVTQATDGANVQYDINTAQINAGANGTITAPTTDGVATAANVAEAINSAAWNIKANDNEATAIKAGTTVGLKAGNNLTLSQSDTDFTYALNDELTGIQSLTTVAQDGVTTTLAASGVTIASSGTGNKLVSLTANGLNNGGRQITDVASGGDTDTNAANISDVKRLVQASASGTTETGFNVKGDDATAKKVKLGKQLNVVGGTNDTSKLSDGNIGVVTTDDGQGNATLTVKLNKNINLDSVKAGNTTLDTNGVSNGKMNLTGNGMTITDTDPSKQVSVTTNGVSMGSQRIQNVANAKVDTDAATLGQVKNARTKMTAGSNVAGVDSSEDKTTHQMTYTVNVDNLSVKANSEEAKSVTLKNGLTFKDGTNTTASVGEGGVVSFGLEPEISLTKVTTGNTTMDTNGLVISGGPTIAAGGINAGGKTITGVANGVGDNDAVNISQLKAVQSDINAGWTIKGKDTANADVSANIGKGKSVTYSNGNYTKAVVAKDDSGNAAVTVDVTTGTLTTGTDGKITSSDGLATTGDVASAVNGASWTIQDGNHTKNAQQVKAGDKVSLKAGDNLSLDQNGKEFTYKLNKTLTDMTSVTAVDDKQNTSVLNGEGLKVSDKDGNSLTQHATEIRIHDSNAKADDTTTDVVLKKDGLHNGGHTITCVADGQLSADSKEAVNGSQLYALQQKVTNGGWDIIGDNENKSTHIGNDKTVSFKSGKNSTVSVTGTDTGAEVKVDVNTAQISTNDAHQATATGTGLADASEVVNAINSAAWNVQKKDGAVQQVKAGDTVTFDAGNNIVLAQNDKSFTYGLASDVNTNSIRLGGSQDTNGDWTGGIFIGKQIGGGANQNEGNYITGLANTSWDLAKVVDNRAATEAQLREAINQITLKEQNGGFALKDESGNEKGRVSQTLGNAIAIVGDTEYESDGKTVKKAGNITTEADGTNVGGIKVKLNKNLDLSDEGSLRVGSSKVSNGAIQLGEDASANKILMDSTNGTASIGGVTVNGAKKTVNGLSNTKWTGTAVDGQAATENQLVEAINEAKTQAANSELHIKKGVYAIGKDSKGQEITDKVGKNSVSIDVVNATGTVDGQVVINDVAKASELGAVGELADNLKNPAGGPTTVVQAVNKVNQKVDDSLKQVNGDISNAVTEARKHTEVKSVDSDNNVTIDGTTTNAAGGTVYKLGLNKDHLNLGNVHIDGNEGRVTAKTVKAEMVKIDDQTRLDKTGLTTGNTTVADGRVVVGGDNGIKIEAKGDQQTISGLSNRIWTGKAVRGRAATEDQLQQAVENATATAAQNEQHIQSGNYDVGQGKGLDGKPIGKNSVAINVVSGDGTKPGDVKGQVVINNVAKADELGDVAKLNGTVRNGNGHPTSTVDAINNLDNRVETKVGDNTYSRVKGKEIADGDSATTAIGKLNNRMNDIYTTAGQHSTVSTADANLTLSEGTNASGGTDYKLGLNKEHIDLGNVTINGNAGSIKADSFTAGDTVVNKDGVKVGDKSALTGDSLKVGGKTYVDDKGINANGKAIGNVGDGKNDGDAVNVKQVNDLAARQGEAIDQNAAHINQLDRAVNRLDSRINRVGAGAAALAALHPGNYDPDDKVDFAAGFGNYRGASAAAVGMYYHPDETTTMSVGASFGGGENMVNAGITWKMGKDSGHMRTQAATKAVPVQFVAAPTQTQQSSGQAEGTKMPQPVTAVTTTASGQQVPIVAAYLPSVDSSTRAENDELKELLARQTAILEKLADQKTAPAQAAAPVSGEDLFPDVPENHWAYDFVAKLAQAGALKDCRVEDPANNPMLTRNDFAQILYTALKNGATKNPALNKDGGLNHLANEFRAELKNVKR